MLSLVAYNQLIEIAKYYRQEGEFAGSRQSVRISDNIQGFAAIYQVKVLSCRSTTR